MGNITEVTEPLLIYTLSADRPNNESKRSFDGQRVRENRERYIALHRGIGYFHQDVADPYTRLLAWQKVKDYAKVKNGHEWVWLLDSDAFIMNGEISGLAVINSHIAEVKKRTSLWECRDIDIVLCKDRNGINTGSVFIRSSEWTDKFIEKWISYENDTEILKHDRIGIFEQPAFNHMFNNNILNLKDHLSIIDQRKMNSYWENYQTGDYILHAAGRGFVWLVDTLKSKGLHEV